MKPKTLVIPSIDIQNGKTVRVVQGIPELNCAEYGNDPVEMAMIWRAENAKCLHVVDFDDVHERSHENFDLIGEICDSVIIPVQLGGGIRSFSDAEEVLKLGISRLIISTMAMDDKKDFIKLIDKYGPSKISVAIDVVNDEVIIRGRSKNTGILPEEFAREMKEININRFVVTDVNRNGMMLGPNIELSKRIATETGAKVTLSGGVSGFEDLMKVQDIYNSGVDSVIIGRALYENKFPCQKIWRVAESGIFN